MKNEVSDYACAMLCHLKFAGELIALLGCSRRALIELFQNIQYCFTNGRRSINSSPQLHLEDEGQRDLLLED